MPDDDDFDDQKRLRAAENLGWLAGSGSYTKKRKLIEGSAVYYEPGQVAMSIPTRLMRVTCRSLGG